MRQRLVGIGPPLDAVASDIFDRLGQIGERLGAELTRLTLQRVRGDDKLDRNASAKIVADWLALNI